MRFDVYLVENGFYESRNKASSAIKNGCFSVNGAKVLKPSYDISESDVVTLLKQQKNYVARSAHKLLTAYDLFGLSFDDKTVVDLGASTGGFCQVLLEKGASKVYAVDIGTAQLHPKIKEDPRIINMEHTNARYLKADDFDDKIDAITADLSFISIKTILPAISLVLNEGGFAIILVKPQFEAGPAYLNKSGVVLDRKIHLRVLKDVIAFACELGFGVKGVAFSGLTGESGNREYLLHLEMHGQTLMDIEQACSLAVQTEEFHE